jgi:hypothetical protein
MIRVALLLGLLALPAAAQERIAPEAFLDAADGRTLTFRTYPTGELVGIEEFLSRTRTVWARADRSCAYGRVEVRDERLCFLYDDEPGVEHCWVTLRRDTTLYVLMPGTGEVQRVSDITDKPVACTNAPLS